MQKRTIAQLCISLTVLTVLALLYGLSLYLHAPKYWETIVCGTLVYMLFAAAILRFLQVFVSFLAGGTEPHMNHVGERTYRRCGLRELLKLTLMIMVLRLLEVLLTYLLHFRLFGYAGTFFEVQRIWLDFYHVETAFPLYGYLSDVFWVVSFNFNHARFIGSYLFTALAGAALYYLVQLDFDRKTARRTVLLFFLLPASCLLMGTVPDGLFLLISIGCLLFLRHRLFAAANAFGLLAVLTHPLGALLFFPILLEYIVFIVDNIRSSREMEKGYVVKQIFNALSFLLIPIGIVLVFGYAQLRFGDALALYKASVATYGIVPSTPSDALFRWFDRVFEATKTVRPDTVRILLATALPQLLYLIGGCVLVILGCERIRTSHVFFLLLAITSVLCTGYIDGTAHILTMTAPFTIALTVRVRRGWVSAILILLLLSSLTLYFYAFIAGYTGGVL